MGTIVPDASAASLPLARHLQAVGFRSWPAETTTFDGAWAIRLTAEHPSQRQNSVNPLDPGDASRLDARIDDAASRFEAFGRPPTFLISPLAPPVLDDALAARGWAKRDESIVMLGDLDAMDLGPGTAAATIAPAETWLDAQVALGSFPADRRVGVERTLASIRPMSHARQPDAPHDGTVGLHLAHHEGSAAASLLSVRFGALIGMFQIVTDPMRLRQGHARRLIQAVLRDAARDGARQVWLQVERANLGAVSLYESLGMREAYGYHYRRLDA